MFTPFSTQIRQTLTKQAFEDAGIRVQQVTVPPVQSPVKIISQNNGQVQSPIEATTTGSSQHLIHPPPEVMMTLNRLNAQEEELDAEEDALSTDFVEEVVTG